jgi:hypothetical protein
VKLALILTDVHLSEDWKHPVSIIRIENLNNPRRVIITIKVKLKKNIRSAMEYVFSWSLH